MRKLDRTKPKLRLKKERLATLEEEHLKLLVAGAVASCPVQFTEGSSSCSD